MNMMDAAFLIHVDGSRVHVCCKYIYIPVNKLILKPYFFVAEKMLIEIKKKKLNRIEKDVTQTY